MTKKFIEKFGVDKWEIETPQGWEDIEEIGKTIEYDTYLLVCDKHSLYCADNHIVIDANFNEQYVKDLKPGDIIQTDASGTKSDKVLSVTKTQIKEHMYDIRMGDDTTHTYYTNGILSHNTLWLGNIAINMVNNGLNGALISLEMPETRMMLERLGPKMYNMPVKEFKDLSQNPFELQKKIEEFKNNIVWYGSSLTDPIYPGKLYLKEYPTSTASVNDVEIYLRKLEEVNNMKLDFVVIDYINIMLNSRNPNTENTYMKIKQLAEDLRAMGQRMNLVVISATQTKRGTEESSDFGSGDIAEASSLSHTVDSMWGIIRTPEMYRNKEYILKNLLNRFGGLVYSRKKFNVNWEKMNIIETGEPIQEDNF